MEYPATIALLLIALALASLVWHFLLPTLKEPETRELLPPPRFLGYKLEGNGALLFFHLTQLPESNTVYVVGGGEPREVPCYMDGATCKLPVPLGEVTIIFPWDGTFSLVINPETFTVTYLQAPLSADVNEEVTLRVGLCSEEPVTGVLTVLDDGTPFFTETYTVEGCKEVNVAWVPSYTGVHTLAARAANGVTASVFVGESVADVALGLSALRVFEEEGVIGTAASRVFGETSAVGGSASRVFGEVSAVGGGAWDCPDDLNNCFVVS